MSFASYRFLNQCWLKHSSWNFPLKLSMYPFCVGLPGSVNICFIWWSYHQPLSALDMNSDPLSVNISFESPLNNCFFIKTAHTCLPVNELSTSKAMHSLVVSSMTVKIRILLLYEVLTKTKFIDHLVLAIKLSFFSILLCSYFFFLLRCLIDNPACLYNRYVFMIDDNILA